MTEGFSCPKASWDTGTGRAKMNRKKKAASGQGSIAGVWHHDSESQED